MGRVTSPSAHLQESFDTNENTILPVW